MTQSLTKQIADLKKRIEAAKGTPAEATFQDILADLEKQLSQGQDGETPKKTATKAKTTSKTKKDTAKETSEVTTPEVTNTEVTTTEVTTTEVTTTEVTNTEVTTTEVTNTEDEATPKEKKDKSKPKNFFQAVGLLRGVIRRKDDKSGWYVEQGQNQYDLAVSKKLQYVIRFVEGKELTLTVYPQVRYEKGDREYCKIYFKLVGWSEERSPNEGLFTLKGIWQFIPQYKRPVISIYRNQKQWEGDRCKASHVPVLWKDSPIKPFKFNPKAETQSDKYFAQVQTKFIPRLNTFGVVEEMDESTLRVPKYIKPVKKDLGDSKPDSKGDSQDSKSDFKKKTKDKTETKIKTKSVVNEVTTEVKPEVTTEVKPEVTAEVKPEVTAEVKPEVTAEVTTEVKPETDLEVTNQTEKETVSETKTKAKAKTRAKTKK